MVSQQHTRDKAPGCSLAASERCGGLQHVLVGLVCRERVALATAGASSPGLGGAAEEGGSQARDTSAK